MDTSIHRPIKRWALILISWIMAQGAFGVDKITLLNNLYDNTGLVRQLDWIHASMTLNYQEYNIPVSVIRTFNQVVNVRYSPDFHKSSMTATLDEALSVSELLELSEWHNSELGQKILKLEAQANNPGNMLRMQAYINEKLSQTLPRTKRIQLIEELIDTLDAVELGTELAASASVGARRILHEVMPTQNGTPLRPLQVLKAQERLAIRKSMEGRIRNVYLYTYRSLPDHEIEAYLEFAKRTAVRNFQRGQILAISRIL